MTCGMASQMTIITNEFVKHQQRNSQEHRPLMLYTNLKQLQRYIILLDFEKAFDSVE